MSIQSYIHRIQPRNFLLKGSCIPLSSVLRITSRTSTGLHPSSTTSSKLIDLLCQYIIYNHGHPGITLYPISRQLSLFGFLACRWLPRMSISSRCETSLIFSSSGSRTYLINTKVSTPSHDHASTIKPTATTLPVTKLPATAHIRASSAFGLRECVMPMACLFRQLYKRAPSHQQGRPPKLP